MLAPADIAEVERQLAAMRDEWRRLNREHENLEFAPQTGDPEAEQRIADRLVEVQADMAALRAQAMRLVGELSIAEHDRMFDIGLHPEEWE